MKKRFLRSKLLRILIPFLLFTQWSYCQDNTFHIEPENNRVNLSAGIELEVFKDTDSLAEQSEYQCYWDYDDNFGDTTPDNGECKVLYIAPRELPKDTESLDVEIQAQIFKNTNNTLYSLGFSTITITVKRGINEHNWLIFDVSRRTSVPIAEQGIEDPLEMMKTLLKASYFMNPLRASAYALTVIGNAENPPDCMSDKQWIIDFAVHNLADIVKVVDEQQSGNGQAAIASALEQAIIESSRDYIAGEVYKITVATFGPDDCTGTQVEETWQNIINRLKNIDENVRTVYSDGNLKKDSTFEIYILGYNLADGEEMSLRNDMEMVRDATGYQFVYLTLDENNADDLIRAIVTDERDFRFEVISNELTRQGDISASNFIEQLNIEYNNFDFEYTFPDSHFNRENQFQGELPLPDIFPSLEDISLEGNWLVDRVNYEEGSNHITIILSNNSTDSLIPPLSPEIVFPILEKFAPYDINIFDSITFEVYSPQYSYPWLSFPINPESHSGWEYIVPNK